MLEALSLEARTRGKDRRRKLSAFLSLSLSLSLSTPLLSSPPIVGLLLPLSYRPTAFLTTRHCVPPRWNPVYSLTLWIFRKRFAASRARCTVWPRHAAPFFLRFLVFELSFRRWNRIARRAWSRDSKAPVAWIGTRPPLRLPRDRPFDDENDEIDRTSHPFPGIGRYESARSMVGNGVRGKTWFRDDDAIAASENEAASNEPKRASDSDGSIGSRVRTEADRMSQTRLNPRDAKQWLYRATDRPTDRPKPTMEYGVSRMEAVASSCQQRRSSTQCLRNFLSRFDPANARNAATTDDKEISRARIL